MRTPGLLALIIGCVCSSIRAEEPNAREKPVVADLVIKNGLIVDGTGAPAKKGDLALKGERIIAVGIFTTAPKTPVIDATDLVVAPGFIDLHSHSDNDITKPKTRSNLNYQTQGVTTVVTGNCGGGVMDVAKYLESIDAHGAGTNVIHLIPHGAVRSAVIGTAERAPSPQELDRMEAIVERGMRAGAWGLSSGLIYVPSRYAEVPEMVALSKIVARHGGIYASHIRDEGAGLLNSIDETLAVGREAQIPVHISHLKATGRANWGLTTQACARIKEARAGGAAVSADQYPYVASSTQLGAMVVPHWAMQGGTEEFARIESDPAKAAQLRREIEAELKDRDGGASLRIARYKPRPERVGHNLVAIARQEGTTPLEIVLDIQRHGGAQAISFGMSEDDVRQVMTHDFVATASDGSTHQPGGGDQPHPRAYGTFPRKIRYALDEKVLTLEQAVRSCTSLPAEILHLPDRGVIREGNIADLVVFNPKTFRDAATFDRPTRYAPGVAYLFVNGVAAIAEGKPKKILPGRSLRLTKDGPADLIISLGRIWTGDAERPWAEALASRGGAIAAVGSRTEAMRFQGPRTRVIDRPDAFATPGLIDAHGHLCDLGAADDEIDLRGVNSVEKVASQVKAWIEAHPGDSWVIGRNWDQSLWPGGSFPDTASLDAVAPKRPVWLSRVDGHAGWANTEALKRGQVTRETEAPAGGQILHKQDGEPTGVFIDAAMDLVGRRIPPASRADFARQILKGQALLFQEGLTGVHDAGVSRLEAEAYRELDRSGQLKLRVYGMASPPEGGEVAFVSHGPLPAKPEARFQLRAVKLFIDGAMGSRGGLLFEPYSDDPGNKGLQLIASKTLEAVTVEALKHGWQIATHAIGDKGNALVLDAYEAAFKAVPKAQDPRFRVEHAQVVRRSDIARFAQYGIIASMQPSHASDDMRWADARLGPERVQGAYAWRWFLEGGVRLAFGSDFPVEVVNPFYGVYAALTRQDESGHPSGGWHPDQRMSLEETLQAFTAGAAFASFSEDRVGVLKTGFRADVTVVDRDLFKVSPIEVLETKVVMTVVDGEVVYQK